MSNPELSIIMPGVAEYPQVAFTIQSIFNELRDEVDFELIYIDNYCPELAKQNRANDKSVEYLESIAQRQPWLKVLTYTKKLSHWNAKNIGIQHAKAPILFFSDAHCSFGGKSLVNMFKYFYHYQDELDGTLHLPLSYLLEKPGLELQYKLVSDTSKGKVHYSFTRYNPVNGNKPYRVPCMSTCGMMISKKLMMEGLGLWPSELGIYGGGENFINFCLAVMGKNINIFPTKYPLYHYAEKRGYSWNSGDWMRNRMIAAYLHSDQIFVTKMRDDMRGSVPIKNKLLESVIYHPILNDHRELIKSQTKMSIEEYCRKWGGT